MALFGNYMSNNHVNLIGNDIYNNGTQIGLNLTFINNSTIYVVKGTNITLFSLLTDDKGNNVSGQYVFFFINNTYVGSAFSGKGKGEVKFKSDLAPGKYIVSGIYQSTTGNNTVLNGTLYIVESTTIKGSIILDKIISKINEKIKGTVSIKNTGYNKAYGLAIKIKFPSEFKGLGFIITNFKSNKITSKLTNKVASKSVNKIADKSLNKFNIFFSKGYFNYITNTWFIDELNPGETATLIFMGKILEIGEYNFSIAGTGYNINNFTEFTTIKVKNGFNPNPPNPHKPKSPKPSPKPNNVNMKNTGISLLVLLLSIINSLVILKPKSRFKK